MEMSGSGVPAVFTGYQNVFSRGIISLLVSLMKGIMNKLEPPTTTSIMLVVKSWGYLMIAEALIVGQKARLILNRLTTIMGVTKTGKRLANNDHY
jgi:hypothetical protein